MPTYKNEAPARQTIACNGVTWPWGAEAAVPFFVPDERGLTLVSEEPKVAEQCLVAVSLDVADGVPTRVYVPDCDAFVVSIFCESGRASIRRNYESDEPTVITESRYFRGEYSRKSVEAFLISGAGGDASVFINIERLG